MKKIKFIDSKGNIYKFSKEEVIRLMKESYERNNYSRCDCLIFEEKFLTRVINKHLELVLYHIQRCFSKVGSYLLYKI